MSSHNLSAHNFISVVKMFNPLDYEYIMTAKY